MLGLFFLNSAELGPEYEWVPVLYHHDADPFSEPEARSLRAGRRWHGRRSNDRKHANNKRPTESGCADCTVRRDVAADKSDDVINNFPELLKY